MGKIKKVPLYRQERVDKQAQKLQYESALQRALAARTTDKSSFVQLVEGIYHNRVADRSGLAEVRHLFDLFETIKRLPNARKAFRNILLHLAKLNCHRLLEEAHYLTGLRYVAELYGFALRDVASWKKPGHNPARQFSHLLRHCFANYHVPAFMDHAWLGGKEVERRWFVDLANGYAVRYLRNLPVKLTKRMAHEFLQAPDYCTIPEAFRWGQVIALGGDANLAFYINGSLLGRNHFRDDDFWVTVIQFFASLEMFDNRQVGGIVDYISYQRTVQPQFSMKGRTPEALLRQTEAWHRELNRARNRGGALVWKASGIREFIWQEGKEEHQRVYTISELLSSNELLAEGRAMKHCVASYARSCNAGRCSIFSMSVRIPATSENQRLVTIEVDLRARRIVQNRRQFNDTPVVKEKQLIQEWAAQEGLTFSKWL